MTLIQHYIIAAGMSSCFIYGIMVGRGREGWKNMAIAILAGSVWPLITIYGIYLVHFKK